MQDEPPATADSVSVSISVGENPRCAGLCRRLAERLDARLVAGGAGYVAEFHVEVEEGGLALHCKSLPRAAPLRLDFNQTRARAGGDSGADPLVKAMGKDTKTVLDATAGWGADSVHLARRGYSVTALERNPLVAELLLHAWDACTDAGIKARLNIVRADSVAYLRGLQSLPPLPPLPDVVYLDPMYPTSPKSAAPKKPAALLRMLAGPAADGDALSALFEEAMTHATRRVIVKRPHRAPPIHPNKVGETAGKLVRFDIYQPHRDRSAG